MRILKFAVFIGLLIFSFASGSIQAGVRIETELVRLEAADGVKLDGVLRQPKTVRGKTGIIMVHGYSGNFYSGVMAFLPEALAHHGFATLAINMRDHDRGPKKNRFEENRQDIAAAVDEMARRGYTSLILHGHSMGTNRVLYYQAVTQDRRIVGVILTGPPGNLLQWNIRMFGSKAATRVLRQAQNLVKNGKGDQWMLVDLGPLGKALYTANHLVSLRGPDTLSDPFKNITRITQPVLIIHGLSDRLADPEVTDRLRNSAASNVRATAVKIPGADHSFRNCRKELVEIIKQWLKKQQSL